MRIGLIAHDRKKEELIAFVGRHRDVFGRHLLYATGHTGRLLEAELGLTVHCFMAGPEGGDQQMGSQIAQGEMDWLFFLRDPLFAHPHEPDVSALLRISDVRSIPVATNLATAEAMISSLAAVSQGDGR